nr:hypothetical protein [Tanacetum cinerariifolium]
EEEISKIDEQEATESGEGDDEEAESDVESEEEETREQEEESFDPIPRTLKDGNDRGRPRGCANTDRPALRFHSKRK